MKPILDNIDKDIEGGFYYDRQRSNELLRISLHANAVPPYSDYSDWPAWENATATSINEQFYKLTDAEGKNWDFKSVFSEDSSTSTVDGRSVLFGKQSLCNSIMTEDFNVSIANNWTDFSGGQQIQEIFNGFKGYEPYLNRATSLFSEMSKGITGYQSNIKKRGETDNGVSGYLDKAAKFLKNASAAGSNIIRRSLVVQGTRFKYYAGTGIDFSNLGMKVTLFPDYFNGVFKTIEDQLANLYPYAIGKYVDFLNESDKEMQNIANKVWSVLKAKEEVKSETKQALNSYLGWQIPPGGFKASVEHIDQTQFGTLMLKIGPMYNLKSLLIQSIQLNYSKHLAKYIDKNGELKTCPLYCDVFITFVPANKYSDKKLKEFVLSVNSNNGLADNLTELENTINTRLNLK